MPLPERWARCVQKEEIWTVAVNNLTCGGVERSPHSSCVFPPAAWESPGPFCQPHVPAWPRPGLAGITQPCFHQRKQGKLSTPAPISLASWLHTKPSRLEETSICAPWCELKGGHESGVPFSHLWPRGCGLPEKKKHGQQCTNVVKLLCYTILFYRRFSFLQAIFSSQEFWVCSSSALDPRHHLCIAFPEVSLDDACLNFYMGHITQLLWGKGQNKG